MFDFQYSHRNLSISTVHHFSDKSFERKRFFSKSEVTSFLKKPCEELKSLHYLKWSITSGDNKINHNGKVNQDIVTGIIEKETSLLITRNIRIEQNVSLGINVNADQS